jgi:hypothetical protein
MVRILAQLKGQICSLELIFTCQSKTYWEGEYSFQGANIGPPNRLEPHFIRQNLHKKSLIALILEYF